MVEMALLDLAQRAEWDAWYVAHQHRLLSIPGFRASQPFEAIHAATSPFVAIHEVDSPDVFTSASYRAQAGPTNTGPWRQKMGTGIETSSTASRTPPTSRSTRVSSRWTATPTRRSRRASAWRG